MSPELETYEQMALTPAACVGSQNMRRYAAVDETEISVALNKIGMAAQYDPPECLATDGA